MSSTVAKTVLGCCFFSSLAVATFVRKKNSTEIVYEHVEKSAKNTFREPSGMLRYKYLVPAGPYDQVPVFHFAEVSRPEAYQYH